MRRFIRNLPGLSLVLFTVGFAEAELVGARGHLEISDDTLSDLWNRAHVAFLGADGSYRDELLGASFERRNTDPSPALRAHYYLDGSTEYPRSVMSRSFFPSGNSEESLSNYSLHWPSLLEEYHRFKGDDAYVRALVESALPAVMDHFEGLENRKGLLVMGDSSDSAITNLLYYRALKSTAQLHRDLAMDASPWDAKAHKLRRIIVKRFWNTDVSAFVANRDSDVASVAVSALAVCFGLAEEAEVESAVALIRKEGTACDPWLVPYVIEACFIAGEQRLAIDMTSFVEDFSRDPSPLYLIPQYVFGIAPGETGWDTIEVMPRFSDRIASARLEVPLPGGRVTFAFDAETGASVTIPVTGRAMLDGPEGMSMVVKKYRSHTMPEQLSTEARAALDAADWSAFAGEDAYIWVSIDEQMLRIVRANEVEYEARCASAEKGIGSIMNSLQTPLGWHTIKTKIGDDAPWGQVFRSRRPTREVWQPGEDTTEDLVLSRILLLDGEEPGLNKGGKVDSLARNIYIHGTNDEARIGQPTSHGCIRMLNDDVIEMFGIVGEGMKVLITGTVESEAKDL